MAVYQLTRFEVRADANLDVERAMHDLASFVRKELPDSAWTVYRDPDAPSRFCALLRAANRQALGRHGEAAGVRAFEGLLAPVLVGSAEVSEWELVTSSDLAPRPRADRRRR